LLLLLLLHASHRYFAGQGKQFDWCSARPAVHAYSHALLLLLRLLMMIMLRRQLPLIGDDDQLTLSPMSDANRCRRSMCRVIATLEMDLEAPSMHDTLKCCQPVTSLFTYNFPMHVFPCLCKCTSAMMMKNMSDNARK
jgi:hypothetical protein